MLWFAYVCLFLSFIQGSDVQHKIGGSHHKGPDNGVQLDIPVPFFRPEILEQSSKLVLQEDHTRDGRVDCEDFDQQVLCQIFGNL